MSELDTQYNLAEEQMPLTGRGLTEAEVDQRIVTILQNVRGSLSIMNMNTAAVVNADYVSGRSGGIDFNESGRIEVSNHFDPPDAGNKNLGGATRYWGDISYKTLTDRGCLGWYDEGVLTRDGRILTDLEALMEIRPDPVLLTPAGQPRLDYKTLPAHVYIEPKDHEGNVYPKDQKGEYYAEIENKEGVTKRVPAQEGAETTALISILLGAIKELNMKVLKLETDIKK